MSLSQALNSQGSIEQALKGVEGQKGIAVLDLSGNVLSTQGDFDKQASEKEKIKHLYHMLQDVRGIVKKDKFQKIDVQIEDCTYVASLTTDHVIIVKKQL